VGLVRGTKDEAGRIDRPVTGGQRDDEEAVRGASQSIMISDEPTAGLGPKEVELFEVP
jgi:ABC-type polar amino acid transport system ATPase subunit